MLVFKKELLNGIVLPAFLAANISSDGYVGASVERQVLEGGFEKDGLTAVANFGNKTSNFL